MKIGFFELEKWEEEYIKKNLKKHKLVFEKEPLSEKNVKKYSKLDIVVCFIYSKINPKIISEMKNLKFISTMSTGFDHIDLETCRKRRIKVSNVPYYGENTVAEHTFGLILALVRHLHKAIERTKEECNFSIEGLRGIDLAGKTLGVIGPGRIGQHVIRIAKGFGMDVIAFSPHKDEQIAKTLGFKYVSLNDLLKKSDVITIHAPLNDSTFHMINVKNVKMIKKGAYLINTARGGIVDTTALLYALDNGILAGAGLDVLEGEDDIKDERELLRGKIKREEIEVLIENHALLKERNVVITPHIAFYTKEALERILNTTMENIAGFSKGKLVNEVRGE